MQNIGCSFCLQSESLLSAVLKSACALCSCQSVSYTVYIVYIVKNHVWGIEPILSSMKVAVADEEHSNNLIVYELKEEEIELLA